MEKSKKNLTKKLLCVMLAVAMIATGLTPMAAYAAEGQNSSTQKVTVTIEYIDENGSTEYWLEPTSVDFQEGATSIDVLNEGYKHKGTVENTGIMFGVKVTPTGEEGVSESINGDKKWVTFVNSQEKGKEYVSLADGDVIRLIYTQNHCKDISDYTPGSSLVGSLEINKNNLIEKIASLTQEQKKANKDVYENALTTALVNGGDQKAVSEAEKKLDEILSPEVSAEEIQVTPSRLQMEAGDRQTLSAQLIPENSSDEITWSSTDETVAKVNDNGTVYAMARGQAFIVASANEKVKTEVPVTVTGIAAEEIILDKTEIELTQGEGYRLTAKLEPLNTTDIVKFSSEDPRIASVDDSGLIVGIGQGKTKIVVSAGDCQAVCQVIINERKEAEEPTVIFQHADGRITELKNDEIELSPLDVGTFKIEGIPGNYSVSWDCSEKVVEDGYNTTRVHIMTGGEFSPYIGQREAKVYISDENGKTTEKTFSLKVVKANITELKAYYDGIPIGEESIIYLDGRENEEFCIKGKKEGSDVFINIPTQALNTSCDEGIYVSSAMDKMSFFLGADVGQSDNASYKINVSMAEDENVSISFGAVHNKVQVEGLEISCPEIFYIDSWNGLGDQYIGLTAYGNPKYSIDILPSNASNTKTKWISHNPDIAEYQETYNNGIVPKKAGTAHFTVISEDNPSVSEEVTVEFRYKTPVESVSPSQSEYKMKQYDAQEIEINVLPSDATEQRFVWTYSQENIVSVIDTVQSSGNSDGQKTTVHTLNALNPGTVTVTGTPIDNTNNPEPVTFKVTVTENSEKPTIDIDKYVTENKLHGQKYMKEQLEGNYFFEAEWAIFSVLRSGGQLDERDLNDYCVDLLRELNSDSRILPTDYFRVVITLAAMGQDPTDFEGINILERMYNYQGLNNYTSNMMSFTLMAYDAGNWEIPDDALWSREELIDMILAFQNQENGGFGLVDNATVSVDITAMTLQALAPYNNEAYPQVQEAFEKGLDYLKSQMLSDCGYNVEGGNNGCSAAQVLMALCTAGIDPLDPQNGFVRGDANLVTKLDDFKQQEGFSTLQGASAADGMASYQITCALEAYDRFINGKNSLFDMTDVEETDIPVVLPDEPSDEPSETPDDDSEGESDKTGVSDDNTAGGTENNQSQNASQGQVPETGDTNSPYGAAAGMLMAALMIAVLGRKSKHDVKFTTAIWKTW